MSNTNKRIPNNEKLNIENKENILDNVNCAMNKPLQNVLAPEEFIKGNRMPLAVKDVQSNMWMGVINNPQKYGYSHDAIIEKILRKCKTVSYMAMADEKGECFHTHFFAYFNSRVRFSTLKKLFPEAHLERCRGNVSENVSYIKKDGKWANNLEKQEQVIDGTFCEWGIRPPDSKGTNNMNSQIYAQIKAGYTNIEILDMNQDYIFKTKDFDKVRTEILIDRNEEKVRTDLEVIYIYGKTGCGKTRMVCTKHGYRNVFRVTNYKHPYDNYHLQNVLFLDEFRSQRPFSEILNIVDVHPTELDGRYSSKVACYDYVYFASNWSLEDQYKEVQKEHPDDWDSFIRRITKVIVFEENGEYTEYNSTEEYFNRNK